MSKLTIKSDKKWIAFKYREEVPKKVLSKQFDHLDEDEAIDGFFRYRNYWYHLSDFMRVPKDAFPGKWNGYLNDSYFSGVVIQVSNDGEAYKVGTFYS